VIKTTSSSNSGKIGTLEFMDGVGSPIQNVFREMQSFGAFKKKDFCPDFWINARRT